MRFLLTVLALTSFATSTSAQTRYLWTGDSGPWDIASNWTPEGVPAAADTAVVNVPSNTLVTLTAPTTVAGLVKLGNGRIGGDFDLTVTDSLLWRPESSSLATFQGTGTITAGPEATMRMAGAPSVEFVVSSGRTVVNEGLAVWETVANWAGEGRLVNEGELVLAFGQTDPFGFIFSSLADALTNTSSGVIRRTGTGEARLQSGFVNHGLVRVENGTLDLRGFGAMGTSGAGQIEVEPGAELRVSGGQHRQRSVTGAALTADFNGALTVTESYDVDSTRFLATAGSDARLRIDGVGTTAVLELAGGGVGGSGTLTVTDAMAWTGGQMDGSGTTVLAPPIAVSIDDFESDGVRLGDTRTLRVEGATTWTGAFTLGGFLFDATTFENAGTFTSSGLGEREIADGGSGVFRNVGTLVHTEGTLRFEPEFHNGGEVRVEGGVMNPRDGGTDTGRYAVADGAQLAFSFGTRTLAAEAEVAGTGAVAFSSGAVTNAATWRPGDAGTPGVLAVSTDHDFGPGVLEIELGGLVAGTEFDQLAVAGEATLGGTLRVLVADGFEPSVGDRFLVIPAGSVTGTFDALDLPDGVEATVEVTDEGAELVIGQVVANEGGAALPTAFALGVAYPNPFGGTQPRATLVFDLPEAAYVRLALYDVLGREVAVLVDEERAAGRHTVTLDAGGLPSGVYLVRMTAGAFAQTRRLTLLR